MTDVPTEVPAYEHGRLRLYALDTSGADGRRLVAAMAAEPRDPGPLTEALGAERVDPYWVDLVALRDIDEIGLAGYLRQGYEVTEDQIADAALDLPERHVLIVPSRALGDEAQTLAPRPPLRPVAVFDIGEDVGTLRSMAPTEASTVSTATPNASADAGPPNRRGLRPAAILILLVIAALFILLVAR